MKTFTGQ